MYRYLITFKGVNKLGTEQTGNTFYIRPRPIESLSDIRNIEADYREQDGYKQFIVLNYIMLGDPDVSFGEWMNEGKVKKCCCCRETIVVKKGTAKLNYCPHCGIQMITEEEIKALRKKAKETKGE